MRLRSMLLAAALFAAAIPVLATPAKHNGSEMWYDPNESGWGLNIFHQGDTLFASLFVYGADGRPRWYTASNLAGSGDSFSGGLYESTGPWFGGPFNPAAVTVRQVGTMTVALGDAASVVTYSVDGVNVTKNVVPWTFRATNLSGIFYGYEYQPAADGTAEIERPLHMIIDDKGSSITMFTTGNSESGCDYTGTRGQHGAVATVSGTTTHCSGAGGSGPWAMAVDLTPEGFTGSFTGNGIGNPWGRIAAAHRTGAPQYNGNGYRTDNWFVPQESGWGVNIVEQGDTLFATLFVYDRQGQPRWYVASGLTQSGSGLRASYSGPLYETTGPYFGTTFDPAAVRTRQVGTMGFMLVDPTSASLSYTIDGVQVVKRVSRNAFRKNDLSGSYVGYTLATNDDAPASHGYSEINIAITDTAGGFSMTTGAARNATAPDTTCTYQGPAAAQSGEYRFVAGTYTCGAAGGTFTMEDIYVTHDGFTATFRARGIDGYIVGARRGTN